MRASHELQTLPGWPFERGKLLAAVAQFQAPSAWRSVWQFTSTFLALAVLETAMYACLQISFWITLGMSLAAAGLTVRLFIIQHDCGHGSFSRSRRLNTLLGHLCSAVTFTPYTFWRRQHSNHHACFNNLDRRTADLDIYSGCATTREYQALPPARRFIFRAVRHPMITHFVLPPLVFLVLYRVPFDAPASWARERASVYLTNLTTAGILGLLVLILGLWPVIAVQLPIIMIASTVGVWLFSVQHRFEQSQWARHEHWDFVRASLAGSSYLKLPRVLQWFTGNIGFHHIHHLASRVPNYRLQECHEAVPAVASMVTTLTLREALAAPSFALWDEELGRMVRFPHVDPGGSPMA
jgi:acyl-lipid omega-6 desaturase (Delta-12 desaturase)